MSEERVVYTVSELGLLLLCAMLLSIVMIVLGVLLVIDGLADGGMALFGDTFVTAMVVGDRQT